jgi:signal transduction histidine kinase
MLGYLDLLELQDMDESSSEYVAACKENALRLKRLSDDMFSYFLVFGKRDLKIDLDKSYSAESVMHMIAERIFWIEEKSFTTEVVTDFDDCYIRIDAVYFNRVLDNLFSNIEKYADRDESVRVDCSVEDGKMLIRFKNLVRTDENHAESNGIGTKTCSRIMQKMNGEFVAIQENGYYIAEISIPVENDPL